MIMSSSSLRRSSSKQHQPHDVLHSLLLLLVLCCSLWGIPHGAACFVLSTQTTSAASTSGRQQQHQQRHQQQHYSVLYATTPSTTSSSSSSSSTRKSSSNSNTSSKQQSPPPSKQQPQKQNFKHALAILAMPYTSLDKIINERILETVMARCSNAEKLSIVLRCQSDINYAPPSVASLRKYVGEIYSQLWDTYMSNSAYSEMVDPYHLPDVVVYPQNLPNTAPESWIDIQPDLDCVCTFNALCGWISEEATGRGQVFQNINDNGRGGLDEHVAALNAERASRNLPPVHALHVQDDDHQDDTCHVFQRPVDEASYVTFLDDDEDDQDQQQQRLAHNNNMKNGFDNDLLLSGPSGVGDPNNNNKLYDCVAVGGTFDGLHFGHRKLLTLAISSLHPLTGKLTIGITKDEMLKKKKYAQYIPTLQERMNGVKSFLHRLAPGILNRVKLVPLNDNFGPPGQKEGNVARQFDALVLSHETLQTGFELNRHRQQVLGLPPLQLLCTRRTEAHGMSSTTLRRLRHDQHNQQQQQNQNQQQEE